MLDKIIAVTYKGTDVKIPTPSADSVVSGGLNIVYWVAGVMAVIVIIVSGVLYIISTGDAAKVTRAKNGIVGGVAGLIVVLMAYAITGFVIGGF